VFVSRDGITDKDREAFAEPFKSLSEIRHFREEGNPVLRKTRNKTRDCTTVKGRRSQLCLFGLTTVSKGILLLTNSFSVSEGISTTYNSVK
jgi:hypothetical protein